MEHFDEEDLITDFEDVSLNFNPRNDQRTCCLLAASYSNTRQRTYKELQFSNML